MLTRGNQTLTWTVDNRVASVAISGGGTTSMEYDYSGMRVKKNAPGGITLYPFAGYEIAPNGVVSKFIRVGGETVAMKKGIYKYFYHNDHLGSANVTTGATGVRVQTIEYDPWGAVSRSSGPTVDPDTRFTGQKLDPETGLYFYNGRYYDAEIGRFISADPFIQTPYDPQNLNRYSYVINNPQNYVDPDGYFHIHKKKKGGFFRSWFGTIIGAIVAVVTYGAGSAITFGTALSYGLAAKGFVDGAVNGGALGAITGLMTAAAYAYGGVFAGQFAEGVSAEIHGGNFWKAYLKAGWTPYGSLSYDGSFQVACSGCSGLFSGDAHAGEIGPATGGGLDATPWQLVFATREGLTGQRTASGRIIRSNSKFVALPDRSALNKWVEVRYGGKSVTAQVWDVGPWSIDDPYWLENRVPNAEIGLRTPGFGGPPRNPAGIDLSNQVFRDLGMKDNSWVVWRFIDN